MRVSEQPAERSSRALLIIAWVVVGIPAAWGVTQTVRRSMDLFTSPPPAPVAAPVEAPAEAPTTTQQA